MESGLKRTWAEVDLDRLRENYRALRAHIGTRCKFLGVVKADAYGHGAVQVARELERMGADYLSVANLDEAVELRRGGITLPILIFGHTPAEMTSELIKYDLTQTVSSRVKAERYSLAASACAGQLRVHIKVDTGMSRLGFAVRGEHLARGVEDIDYSCSLPHLQAEGIYTHFSSADMDGTKDAAYTREQFNCFLRVLEGLEARGRTFALRHCANSGATLRYGEMRLDMVRPGIALYGAGDDALRHGLRPVMSLKSSIAAIKTLDPDTPVSYGRTFVTARETRMGVLPIGYADGLLRAFSNRLRVWTSAGTAPVRGRICMDMTMVDLTGLDGVEEGDVVEIFGDSQRTDDLAALIGTIPYELMCAVSKRVPRYYMRGGKVVGYDLRLRG